MNINPRSKTNVKIINRRQNNNDNNTFNTTNIVNGTSKLQKINTSKNNANSILKAIDTSKNRVNGISKEIYTTKNKVNGISKGIYTSKNKPNKNAKANGKSNDYKIKTLTNNENGISNDYKIYTSTNKVNGISKGNNNIYISGNDTKYISKSTTIDNKPVNGIKRKNYTYVALPPKRKENFIQNYSMATSIANKYKYKSNTNIINNNNNEYEVSEAPKEADEVVHSNNIVIDLSKDGKISEKVFSSSANRILNFKKNLLNAAPKKDCEICHKLIDSHLYIVHVNSHATEVFKWLYLGTFDNACDIQELRRIKVTHVLNCAVECTNTSLPRDIKELHLKIHDYEGFELFDYFERANDFMNKCKMEGGTVLVHCKYGVSRSVAFVIAYLIKYMKYTADSALKFLMTKRNKIKPNEGFMEQLYNYQRWIKGKN